MKLLSWNVRGLGNPRAIDAIRQLIAVEKPNVFFFSETKVCKEDFNKICRSFGYPNCIAFSARRSSAGGVGLCWTNGVCITLRSLSISHIDVLVNDDSDGNSWRLTGFYGNPVRHLRHESWNLLRTLHAQADLPWMCIGDFNDILWSYEKKGGRRRTEASMIPFRTAIDDCNLIDLKYTGNWYTWERGLTKLRNIRQRLDRGFANQEWWDLIPDFSVRNVVNQHSDHSPIILSTGASNVSRTDIVDRPLRFETFWLQHDECEDIVRETWANTAGFVEDKIPTVLQQLSIWATNKFAGRKKRKKKLAKRLEYLASLDPTDEILLEADETKKLLNLEISQEESYWVDRAHLNWMSMGDRNTKYFHKSATQRKRANTIHSLADFDSAVHHTTSGMLDVAIRYFEKLFSTSSPSNFSPIIDEVTPKVDQSMNDTLDREYTMEEIRTAVFDMAPNKASGPDGFPPAFYQKFWPIVGNDVASYCLSFLNGDTSIEHINSTNVVLIPKNKKPETMKDFRPISLSNVLYKIIAKTLANRFKGILEHCIDPAQSAFIPGRLISDNVLIAYETLHALKRKYKVKKGYFALKMDMSKAYDRVEWGFLEAMMRKLGFLESFISKIMHYVKTVSYSVLVNGSSSDFFSPSRGLRQGDPLSTYLFLIRAEGLSTLLRSAQVNNTIPGVKVSSQAPSITHLLFADDSIMFSEASLEGAIRIRNLIDTYGQCSGQEVNVDKSLIFFSSNTRQVVRNEVKSILRVRVTNDPGIYLGLPSMVGKNKSLAFGHLRDRISSKIHDWNTRFLSMGGKEIFIKSVLQSLPSYTMSCFLLTKAVCNGMNVVIRKYWWKGGDDEKGVHWARWSMLCTPKAKGGLGFRDLGAFNVAMLCKQAWRLLSNTDSLVYKVLKGKYFPNIDFLSANLGTDPSLTWKSVWSSRKLLTDGICWRVGSSFRINPWRDKWVPAAPDFTVKPRHQNVNVNARVSDYINIDSMSWNLDALHRDLSSEDVRLVQQIPLPSVPRADLYAWQLENNGIYSVKSGYHWLMGTHRLQEPNLDEDEPVEVQNFYKYVWGLSLPAKILHATWRVSKGFNSTRQTMYNRHTAPNPLCPRCSTANEDSLHCFRDCPKFNQVWTMLNISWHFDPGETNIREWLIRMSTSKSEYEFKLIICVIWANWHNRNKEIHENIQKSATELKVFVVKYLWEFDRAQLRPPPAAPPLVCRWTPPPQNTFKVNFDGGFDARNKIGYSGIIIRDYRGELMVAGSILTENVASPMAAEALACLHAIQLAFSWGLSPYVFEGDSLAVIRYMQSNQTDRSLIAAIISSCKSLIESFNARNFKFVRKQSNNCAHLLASHRRLETVDRYWVEDEVPEFLKLQLEQDKPTTRP